MKLLAETMPTIGRVICPGRTGSDRTLINHWPMWICAYQNGTLVNGLLTKQAAIAKGTLTLARIARIAAKIDCGMNGIIEKNRPIARPEATVSRQGTHKLR